MPQDTSDDESISKTEISSHILSTFVHLKKVLIVVFFGVFAHVLKSSLRSFIKMKEYSTGVFHIFTSYANESVFNTYHHLFQEFEEFTTKQKELSKKY